jgi:hypothetical protein
LDALVSAPSPDAELKKPDEIMQEVIEEGFEKAGGYERTRSPPERKLADFDSNTRLIVVDILAKILRNGDSPNHHKELDYKNLLAIQLDILDHVIHCEGEIQRLREKYAKSLRVEKLKLRRAMLRLLGSTIAWMLLEFDVAYIRALSRGHDQGFIVGKKGSPAEVLAFASGYSMKDGTTLYHPTTLCLRIGDVSYVEGNLHYPIEIKTFTGKPRRPDRRERRQKKRADMHLEFYARKRSKKVFPGLMAIRRNARKRDLHHWDTLISTWHEASKHGYALGFAEEGIAYGVCHNLRQIEAVAKGIARSWSKPKPILFTGSLDHHLKGLPEIMPFTLFEIPKELKEGILLGDVIVLSFVDFNRVCGTLSEHGFEARWEDDGIHFTAQGVGQVLSGNLLDRLRYECLSTQTLETYIRIPIPKSLLRRRRN